MFLSLYWSWNVFKLRQGPDCDTCYFMEYSSASKFISTNIHGFRKINYIIRVEHQDESRALHGQWNLVCTNGTSSPQPARCRILKTLAAGSWSLISFRDLLILMPLWIETFSSHLQLHWCFRNQSNERHAAHEQNFERHGHTHGREIHTDLCLRHEYMLIRTCNTRYLAGCFL